MIFLAGGLALTFGGDFAFDGDVAVNVACDPPSPLKRAACLLVIGPGLAHNLVRMLLLVGVEGVGVGVALLGPLVVGASHGIVFLVLLFLFLTPF